MLLKEFIQTGCSLSEVRHEYDGVQVIARLGEDKRRSGEHSHFFLTIETILCLPQQQKGFTKFIKEMFDILPASYCGICIDGVHSHILDEWCLRHDWTIDPKDPISYWKLTNCPFKGDLK
jgi:hypothetical protein